MSIVREICEDIENSAWQVVAEQRTRLYAEALKIVRNTTEAEDLASRTILRAFTKFETYDRAKGSCFSWMRAILLSLIATDARHKVNGATYPRDPDEFREDASLTTSASDEQVLANSDHDALHRAIDGLPSDYRDAVVMHYFSELPVGKISEFLRLPVSTVKWRLHVARKILLARLGESLVRHRKAILLAAAAFGIGGALAVAALLLPRVWTGAQSGDLTDARNWAGSDPAVREFRAGGAHQEALYIPTNHVFAEEVRIGEDGTRVTFDLGGDHQLTFGGKWNFDANDSVVEFVSGRIDNTLEEMNLMSRNGDWRQKHSRNTFRLKGEGTEFASTKNVIFSYNGDSNRFEVVDGARFRGAFRFGNRNPRYQTVFVGSGASLSNTACFGCFNNLGSRTVVSNAVLSLSKQANGVSAGCSLEAYAGAFLKVGQLVLGGRDARVIVDGRGTRFEHGGYGSSEALVGFGADSSGNLLQISNGATAAFNYPLSVGFDGASDNRIEVTEGAVLDVSGHGFYVGSARKWDESYAPSRSNALYVARGGVVRCGGVQSGSRAFCIGGYDNPESGGNSLTVGPGGLVTNATWYGATVGWASAGNVLSVDGGRVCLKGPLTVGEGGGTNNVVRLANGGTLVCSAFKMGAGNALEIDLASGVLPRLTAWHGGLTLASPIRLTGLERLRDNPGEFILLQSKREIVLTPEALSDTRSALPSWAQLELSSDRHMLKLKNGVADLR